MDGEVISNAEMQQAMKHGDTVRTVIARDPRLQADLKPVQDFLHGLAWKSQR